MSTRHRHITGMLLPRFFTLAALMMVLISTTASASAEEAKMNALQTALSSTTLSGYVDTSVEWTLGDKSTVVQPVEEPGFRRGWRAFRLWARNYGWR